LNTELEIILLNLEYFIAKRLSTAKDYKSSISTPIVKIAITAIALSIFMMLLSVATGVGLQKKIREKVAAFNGHIIISNFDDNQSEVSSKPISIRQNFYPRFKNIDGIHHIQAVASKAGIIRTEKAFEGVIFKGVGKDFQWNYLEEYLVKGKLPNLKNDLNEEVLISEFLANRLQLKVNDKFVTYFIKENNDGYNLRNFIIVGIYNSGFQDFDANYVIGDLRHLQRINKWKPNEVGSFEVFLDNFDEIESKEKAIYDEIPSTLDASSIIEKFIFIFEWIKLFDTNVQIIFIIMLFISIINIIIMLLVLILEKTQMIGILKAMGSSNLSIRKIFIYQGIFIITRGLLIGNGTAIVLLLLQKHFGIITLNPESYYVNVAPVDINLWNILLINLGTIAICFGILLLPTLVISKIAPSKSIRFQ
jgi:lipoprotein-releasing system permease protein